MNPDGGPPVGEWSRSGGGPAAELEELLDLAIAENPGDRETLGPILRFLVERLGHVPPQLQSLLAERLGLAPIEIAGVVSFSSCLSASPRARHQLEVCHGTGCAVAAGSRLLDAARTLLGIEPGGVSPDGQVGLRVVHCLGACDLAPAARLDGRLFGPLTPAGLRALLRHTVEAGPARQLAPAPEAAADRGPVLDGRDRPPLGDRRRLALRHVGRVDPECLADALRAGAYRALARARDELGADGVLAEIKSAGLRERSVGGFPLALRLELVREGPAGDRYLVVRGDEVGEGGWIEQALLEGDPHGLVEGSAILALAAGAATVVISVRADRSLALARLERAVAEAARAGLIGPRRSGEGASVVVEVRASACDAVSGDETAFLAALEGRRGVPSPRPPHPAQQGFKRAPTLTVGVETVYHVAPLLAIGARQFAALGSPRSTGTKIVWLSGAVRRPGLCEVELGIPLAELIDGVGGGVPPERPLKAVHCGGRSGGPIHAAQLSVPLAYEPLSAVGGSLGSGEIVALDRSVCLVALARHFLELAVEESCGKCPPCRVGTAVLVGLLERIQAGEGEPGDLVELEALARHVQRTSLCVVGQHAPSTLLAVLAGFRGEVEAHVAERRCEAGACVRLSSIRIDGSRCDGCGECVAVCPAEAIRGQPGRLHVVDPEACTRCGACLSVCPVDAIVSG